MTRPDSRVPVPTSSRIRDSVSGLRARALHAGSSGTSTGGRSPAGSRAPWAVPCSDWSNSPIAAPPVLAREIPGSLHCVRLSVYVAAGRRERAAGGSWGVARGVAAVGGGWGGGGGVLGGGVGGGGGGGGAGAGCGRGAGVAATPAGVGLVGGGAVLGAWGVRSGLGGRPAVTVI